MDCKSVERNGATVKHVEGNGFYMALHNKIVGHGQNHCVT